MEQERNVGTKALIDSGAEGLFIDYAFVARHDIPQEAITKPIIVRNVDGTQNKRGTINSQVDLEYKIGQHWHMDSFMVTDLGNKDIILGQPWLEKANPTIDWKNKIIDINSITKVNKSTELAREHIIKDDQPLKDKVPTFLHDYISVFDEEEAKRFPAARKHDHHIKLKEDFEPFMTKLYPLSTDEMALMEKFVDENLAKGYIAPSKSPQASGFFFVGKKDGTARPCQDYIRLNNGTIKDAYPIPHIGRLMDMTRKWRYFTTIDVKAEYNNIQIAPEDRWKAAFRTHRGLFEPTVMFFRLCNSPATFQRFMDDIFNEMIAERKAGVYIDNIITGGETMAENNINARRVVEIMQNNDIYAKIDKCRFGVQEVPYLGMILKPGQIEMDPTKLDGIAKWPTPAKLKDVQSFLGFCNFYRKFIPHYAELSKPLDNLKRKDQSWNWTLECQVAFEALKAEFLKKPILRLPNPSKPFVLETDASKHAYGAVLMQEDDNGDLHPCGFISKAFNQAERNYQIYDRELMAVIQGLKAWRQYLLGPEILIRCDHKNLTYYWEPQTLTPRQARWHLFLSQFNYKIQHIQGIKMVQADALSRRPDWVTDDEEVVTTVLPKELFLDDTEVTIIDDEILKRIKQTNKEDDLVKEAVAAIKDGKVPPMKSALSDWTLEDDILWYKGRCYIPDDLDLRREIVQRHHDLGPAGHPGKHGTQVAVARHYWWPRLGAFTGKYVEGCAQCQQSKVNTHPTIPPLMPIKADTDALPFSTVSMDFITDLPESSGYTALYVVVDHNLSKGIVLIPCTKEETAMSTAKLYHEHVY